MAAPAAAPSNHTKSSRRGCRTPDSRASKAVIPSCMHKMFFFVKYAGNRYAIVWLRGGGVDRRGVSKAPAE